MTTLYKSSRYKLAIILNILKSQLPLKLSFCFKIIFYLIIFFIACVITHKCNSEMALLWL